MVSDDTADKGEVVVVLVVEVVVLYGILIFDNIC